MRLYLVISLLISTSIISSQSVYGQNIIDSISDGLDNVKCFATVTAKSGECNDRLIKDDENRDHKYSDEKAWCCSVRSYRKCISNLAKQECNEQSEKVAIRVMENLQRALTSQDCADYGFIACLTLIDMAIAAAVALVALLLLSCICCCCCCR